MSGIVFRLVREFPCERTFGLRDNGHMRHGGEGPNSPCCRYLLSRLHSLDGVETGCLILSLRPIRGCSCERTFAFRAMTRWIVGVHIGSYRVLIRDGGLCV